MNLNLKKTIMETTELMIGDIVHVSGCLYPQYVMSIHNFDDLEVADTIDSDCWNMVSILDIEPLQLTEEVLKMMGFEKQESGYIIGYFGQFIIGRTPAGDFYANSCICSRWRGAGGMLFRRKR